MVCKGQTATLTDTTAAGSWTSSNTLIASVAAGMVTGVNTGTANISYTLPNGCNSSTTTTVSVLPANITGTASACVSATTKLSDGTAGGTWASSNTLLATVDNTGLVSGIAAGTITISYSLPSGCQATRSVTINALPAAITGTTYACKGQTTTLSDSDAGGTWTSSNTNIATIGAGSGTLNGVNAGTATITYRLTTGCTTTRTMTVEPAPTSISGVASLCAAGNMTLSNATAGGAWSSSNTTVISIDPATALLTGIAAGTAAISYTLTGTGCSTIRTMTVNPLPDAITGPAFVCIGLSAVLSDVTPGGIWISSNTAAATITAAAIVSGIAAGTATITYDLTATGCYTTAGMSVYPLPAPVTGIKSVCAGANGTLSNASGGGAWNSSNTSVAAVDAATGIYTGLTPGTSVITYTLGSNSCIVTGTVTVLEQPGAITGTTAACAGLTMTLSNATATGTWSTAATVVSVATGTGVVTAITAGTATITYDVNGCTVITTTTVYALPAPITGIADLCTGNTTALSDAQAGGTWSSSQTSIATIDAVTGSVAGVRGGTSVITYTMPGGCTTTQTVTVNIPPPAIAGNMKVCIGGSTTLSNSTAGGTWASGNTTLASIGISSGVLSGISAGTVTITYTSVQGCIITASVTVNNIPLPITGMDHVCIGLTSTLSNAEAGGTWISSSYIIAPVTYPTGIVTGSIAGTASITYTLPTGCATNILFTVHPLPDAITGPLTVCSGSNIALSNSGTGGAWATANTDVATIDAVTGVLTGLMPGTTTVSYTLPTGCMVTSIILVQAPPPAITGDTQLCLGTITTLGNATIGGLWTSTGSTVSVGVSSGDVTGMSAGTATITYTIYTGCKAYTTVTIDPLPPAITGSTDVCIGISGSLTNGVAGGTWSTAATTISITSTTGDYMGTAAGTALVTYTLPTGCYITAFVRVNDTPSAITGSKSVCTGKTISLTNTLSGGTWASSDIMTATTDAAGGVTGISAGTAAITYTSPFGCAVQTTVTVNALISPITGTTVLCKGKSTPLSDAMTGGIWASSNTSVATISPDGIVTAVAAGTANITYAIKDVCGEATTIITVNPIPDAGSIAGQTSFCKGMMVELTATEKGGTWSSSNAAVATVYAGGSVVGLAAGTATISYIYTNSCGTAATAVTVLVSETPEHAHITTYPASALCTGTRYQNFGTDKAPAAGVRYVWTATNSEVYATGYNKQYCLISFNNPGTGIIRLKAESSNKDCMSYDSLLLNVSATPAVHPSVVYYAPEFVCTDNTADSYQWGYDDRSSLDSTLLTGMVNQNYSVQTPDVSNHYYWVITDHKGCYQKTYYNTPTVVTSVTTTNIEILLFPNPAHDIINIEVKGVNGEDRTEAKIFDVMGRALRTIMITNGTAGIPTRELAPGMYMIKFISNDSNIGSRTFIKE